MVGATPERTFELGDWLVDPGRRLLRSRESSREVRLEPRLMDLLLLFASSQGRVLTKVEIVANVWGGRIVGDDTLAACVSRLRSALGETASDRYIETVPKRGYRLVRAGSESTPSDEAPRPTSRAARLVYQGENSLRLPFPAGLIQARLYFDAAIADEPSLARAHSGLADALLAQHFAGEGAQSLPSARAATLAAIGLDNTLCRPWSVVGMCALLIDRDFATADQAFSRAIGLDPDLAEAHRARAFAFAVTGRFVEAEREARKAIELEPVSLVERALLLQILIAARRYQWAIAAANETLVVAPHAAEGWYAKGWANMFLGDERAGVDAFLRGLTLWGLRAERVSEIGRTFKSDGFAAGCARVADLFEEQGLLFKPRLTDIAILRVAAREFDRAFAILDVAIARDDPYLLLLPWLPHFDPLKSDARFPALLERIRPIG